MGRRAGDEGPKRQATQTFSSIVNALIKVEQLSSIVPHRYGPNVTKNLHPATQPTSEVNRLGRISKLLLSWGQLSDYPHRYRPNSSNEFVNDRSLRPMYSWGEGLGMRGRSVKRLNYQ